MEVDRFPMDHFVREHQAGRLSWEDALDGALHLVLKDLLPTAEDERRRLDLLQRMRTLVARGLSGYLGLAVQPFGSYVIGLYTSGGDLDLTIDGEVTTLVEDGVPLRAPLSSLNKNKKNQLLWALQSRLRNSGWLVGEFQLVRFARIPVFKFTDAKTGLPCDVSVSNNDGEFKSRLLGMLFRVDPRAAYLARLVKLWAKQRGFNDPTAGSMNSYAISLLVVFHLQTCDPPVLPTIASLFDLPPDAIKDRPLHARRRVDLSLLQVAERRIAEAGRQRDVDRGWDAGQGWDAGGPPPPPNRRPVSWLLYDFFRLLSSLMDLWAVQPRMRACPWSATLCKQGWGNKQYEMALEDPFDSTDNCLRTVHRGVVPQIAAAAKAARDAARCGGVHACMAALFKGAARCHMSPAMYSEALGACSTGGGTTSSDCTATSSGHTAAAAPDEHHHHHQQQQQHSNDDGHRNQQQQQQQQQQHINSGDQHQVHPIVAPILERCVAAAAEQAERQRAAVAAAVAGAAAAAAVQGTREASKCTVPPPAQGLPQETQTTTEGSGGSAAAVVVKPAWSKTAQSLLMKLQVCDDDTVTGGRTVCAPHSTRQRGTVDELGQVPARQEGRGQEQGFAPISSHAAVREQEHGFASTSSGAAALVRGASDDVAHSDRAAEVATGAADEAALAKSLQRLRAMNRRGVMMAAGASPLGAAAAAAANAAAHEPPDQEAWWWDERSVPVASPPPERRRGSRGGGYWSKNRKGWSTNKAEAIMSAAAAGQGVPPALAAVAQGVAD